MTTRPKQFLRRFEWDHRRVDTPMLAKTFLGWRDDGCLYLLKNTNNNKIYLRITNNLERRLRQHNNFIKGGAKYTHNFKGNGLWYYYTVIPDLSKSECLSIERSIKNKKKNLILID